MSVAIEPKRDAAPVTPAPHVVTHRAGWRGLGWSSMSQMVGMVIRLGSNLIITRLLVPEAYGLFGTAMALVTTLEWLSDLGIQPALVRHPSGDQTHYLSTGWWMNLWRGLGLSAIMAGMAWPLAMVYGLPSLGPVIAVLALKPFVFAFRSPGMPLLRRSLNYRALFFDEVTQTVVATAVSVTLAWYTRSVWSIVGGTIAGAAASAAISYVLCPIRPQRLWDPAVAKEIAGFGRSVFVNTMVMAVWLNLDRLLGLRLVGEREMGYYAVAWNLAAVVEGLMTRSCDVYFSMLSRKSTVEDQKDWHELVSSKVVSRLMPLMALGVVMAPTAISILYDSRYAGARLLFAIMMARLMARGLGQLQFQYLLTTAQVAIGTRAYLVAMIVQVIILVPLSRAYGVLGMASAALISTTLLTGVQTLLLQRQGVPSLRPFLITLGWIGIALGVLAAISQGQVLP